MNVFANKMNFAKQAKFPYLQAFKDKFSITKETIFAYQNTIFTNYDLPDDLLAHELKHCERQNKFGAEAWIKQYLKYPRFRLSEEIIAFKSQLSSITDRNTRNEVRIKAVRSLASALYGNIVSEKEALIRLK